MHSDGVANAGHSDRPQDLGAVTSVLRGAAHAASWVLTLNLPGPDRLLALLSDGHWHSEMAEGIWPPTGASALPQTMMRALARLGGAPLRLQLCAALDDWPWEREFAALASISAPVPRYLTDLPQPLRPALIHAATPLLSLAPDTASRLALIQAAQQQRRPLVLGDPDLSVEQGRTLERSLRNAWRAPLLLSQALALALDQAGLPARCFRLYGDGGAQRVDSEQGWRPVTALSIDLVSSTSLLQSLGAEAYAQRLQAYHERCSEVILRLEGSLDVPQGDDGLMAYFGFPVAVEDAAARALTAAWQLSAGMANLGLQVRIGAASGQVAISAQQAFGPEIHLAARLCAAAAPGQILVAPSTRDRVGSGFMLEPCGEDLRLKDFAGLKAIHCLRGLQASPPGKEARGGEAASAFVGRRRELDLLRKAWAAACTGRMQWCVVHGEAGIGKSRLLQEFARGLRAQGRQCLELTGQVQSGNSPFAAVVDALRQYWAITPEMEAPQLRQRLEALLPAQHRASDDLGDLARLLVLSRGDEARSGPGVQRRWSELLLDCLHALIETGPFIMLVDDAHWLDPSSLELLRRLRDACSDCPLLVVLGERIEPGRATSLPSFAPLELHGLTESEASELANQLGRALPERVRQRIIERAEGIPLYLEESLRMLSHRDSNADGDVPAKMEDLLMVRLDELGADRALAQLVSVLGREFSEVHLAALLEQDDPFVARARQQGSLGSLLDSGMLLPLEGPAPGYRFKHALIRDAAYGSIWAGDRRRLHGLCAELIERSTPELGEQRPEHLAHHLETAGRHEQARRAWLAAAQLSAARHAHHETLELAQRALVLHAQLPDNAERARSAMQLHLLQASAQIALQGYGSTAVEAAYQAAEQAGAQLTDAANNTLRIRLGLEACYVMRGDLRRAAELAQACVDATDWTRDARFALQSRWALANVQFHQGDWVAALAGFDDCLANYRHELHRSSSVQDPAIMCLGYSSWIHFELGQADEALRRIDRMLALAETLQHPFSSGVAHSFAASMKRLCGDVEGAWPHALEAVRVCERGGFQAWLAHGWMVHGQLLCDRGLVPEGAADLDRGYQLWIAGGARISCATYLVTHAELLLRQGQTQRAVAELGLAWHISEQIGEHYYQAELLRLQGLGAWQAGDSARAEQRLLEALDLATRQRKPGLVLRCALSLGALQAAQGRTRPATERLRTVLRGLSQHGRCRDTRWAEQALACWEIGQVFASEKSTPWEPS